MKGIQKLRISNKYADFRFELRRNITVIQGDSGTGKTTLFDLISEYARLGENSGINVSCDKTCVALTDSDWEHQIRQTKDSLVFVDEGDKFVASKDFAGAIRNTDNYYVLFIRENLYELPYSVEEIYEIKTSGKFHTLKNKYKPKKGYVYGESQRLKSFDTLLTEDSKAGLQFYEHYFKGKPVKCDSAGNNSGIYNWIEKNLDKKIFVVADGAAFGAEMNRIMSLQRRFPDRVTICLPESFEWLILKSGLIDEEVQMVLENPSDYVDSTEYFSWEQFFHKYLVEKTKGTYKQYGKDKIADFYTIENNAKKIAALICL